MSHCVCVCVCVYPTAFIWYYSDLIILVLRVCVVKIPRMIQLCICGVVSQILYACIF